MLKNSFKVKKSINGIMLYGSIEMEVLVEESMRLKIEYDDLNVEQEWIVSVEFGIRYFHEHFRKQEGKGLFVLVTKTHSMLGDSSFSTIFYATVKCLCEALHYPYDVINLNEETGVFEIIK